MISRADNQSGFTLIELLVVVAILGLALALISGHGPMRSAALNRAAAVSEISGGLREARASAIAANRPVSFTLDIAGHSWRIGDLPPHALPPTLGISVLTVRGEVANSQNAGIAFEPDGSSTGGRIGLEDGSRKVTINIDWLTGHVTASSEK